MGSKPPWCCLELPFEGAEELMLDPPAAPRGERDALGRAHERAVLAERSLAAAIAAAERRAARLACGLDCFDAHLRNVREGVGRARGTW